MGLHLRKNRSHMHIYSSAKHWSDPGIGAGIHCATCNLPLDSGVYSCNRYYHQGCFQRDSCRRTPSPHTAYLNSEKTYYNQRAPEFERSRSSTYITDTSGTVAHSKCFRCHREVLYGYYNNGNYVHPECSNCKICGFPVGSTEVTMVGGELYCTKHAHPVKHTTKDYTVAPTGLEGRRTQSNPDFSSMFTNEMSARCDRCGTAIYSGCFNSRRHYHFDCIRCDRCGKKTSINKSRKYGSQIICSKDYRRLTGRRSVTGMDYAMPYGIPEGTECSFRCATCDQLTPYGVYHNHRHYHIDCVRRFYGDRKFKPKRLCNDITPDQYNTHLQPVSGSQKKLKLFGHTVVYQKEKKSFQPRRSY